MSKMKGDSLDLATELGEYAILQKALFRAFLADNPLPQDDEFLLSVPRRGKLVLGETVWLYRKHGAGITFTHSENGLIVDADRKMRSWPEAFDAGRISSYTSSKYNVDAPYPWIKSELDQLHKRGVILDIVDGDLYIIGRR